MDSTTLHPSPAPFLSVTSSLDKFRALSSARVLVTDEHYKHSLAIVRHLGKMGAQVSLLAHSKNSLVARSRYCQATIPSAGSTVDDYVEAALQAVRSHPFDLVIPVSYPMTLAMARQKDTFLRYTHLELVDSNTIEYAANKLQMADLARTVGVPVPGVVATDHPEQLKVCLRSLTFPVVVKPRKESPGRTRVRYARNLDELCSLLDQKLFPEPPIVQEFIPGFGCGFFATYQQGVCKRVFMHRRIREYPATGGVSSCAESFYDKGLETYGRRMLDGLAWHGIAMVEFRCDSRDGEYKLMEINPKFWGSLDVALATGADFPGDLCKMALGETLPFVVEYERNVRYHWPFSGSGDLFHVWTRPRSIFNVVGDFLDPRVKSNIWMNDIQPNIQEVRGLFGQLFRRRKR